MAGGLYLMRGPSVRLQGASCCPYMQGLPPGRGRGFRLQWERDDDGGASLIC